MTLKIGRRLTDAETQKAAVLAAYIDCSPHEWPKGVADIALLCHGYLDLQAALAEAREDAARLQRAREILFAYTDNEITADPWWAVVRNGSFGRMVVLDGPFFSRERAEALRNARLYEYGAKSYVYCFSGHRSQHYKELRAAIGAPSAPPSTPHAKANHDH